MRPPARHRQGRVAPWSGLRADRRPAKTSSKPSQPVQPMRRYRRQAGIRASLILHCSAIRPMPLHLPTVVAARQRALQPQAPLAWARLRVPTIPGTTPAQRAAPASRETAAAATRAADNHGAVLQHKSDYSTQDLDRSTARCHCVSLCARSSSLIFGSNRRSMRHCAATSCCEFQKPTAIPAR